MICEYVWEGAFTYFYYYYYYYYHWTKGSLLGSSTQTHTQDLQLVSMSSSMAISLHFHNQGNCSLIRFPLSSIFSHMLFIMRAGKIREESTYI